MGYFVHLWLCWLNLNKRSKFINNVKGFSMIELMISMVVMGILMGLLVPNMTFFQTKALNVAQKNRAQLLQLSLESYYLTHHGYPQDSDISSLINTLKEDGALTQSLVNPYTNQGYSTLDPSGKFEYQYENHTYSLVGYGKENLKVIFQSDSM